MLGERTASTTDESAVVQVAANAEAEAAATSKAYPTPSEMSLAQDILALASSALSSSTSTTTKDDEKDGNGETGEDKETEEEQEETESNEWKPSWANLLADFQKIGELCLCISSWAFLDLIYIYTKSTAFIVNFNLMGKLLLLYYKRV